MLFLFCIDKFNFFDIMILEVISRFVLDVAFGAVLCIKLLIDFFLNIYRTKVSVIRIFLFYVLTNLLFNVILLLEMTHSTGAGDPTSAFS